jgi:flagellin-specific chaperone FliS
MPAHGATAFARNATVTRSNEQIVVALFERLIKDVDTAIAGCDKLRNPKNRTLINDVHATLNHAVDILEALLDALNHNVNWQPDSGAVSPTHALQDLYEWWVSQLLKAQMHKVAPTGYTGPSAADTLRAIRPQIVSLTASWRKAAEAIPGTSLADGGSV